MERLKKLPEEADLVMAEEEDEQLSPWEPVYRDGSVKHECWQDEGV